MVSILPTPRSPWEAISNSIGEGLSQTLPQAAQQRSNREALQRSLSGIKNVANNPNASNLDVILSTLQAGAGIPGSERYMAQVLPELLRNVEANRGPKTPLPGEIDLQRNRGEIEPIAQRQQLPDRQFGENRFFPTNQGPFGGPGHIPQEATSGQKLPLLAPNEKPAAAKKLQADRKAAGIPTTLTEAMAEVNVLEEDKRLHNKAVDEELKQQVIAQKNYGDKAVKELKKVYPNATPEIESIFKKFGEEEAQKGKSEAEIDRSLAVKAKNFSDQISTIKNDLSAPRTQNAFKRKMEGTYKNLEKASADLRTKLKPLLDMGLYDTARNLVSELGYYPEETDAIVNPLSERELVTLNKIPKATGFQRPEDTMGGRIPSLTMPKEYTPQQREEVKAGLRELKEANPNFSLPLARKVFEDKNYDHRVFRDAINELESEGFELTDDQRKQIGILDTPPLRFLDKILHGLNFIGR